jgi:hypothetical protein
MNRRQLMHGLALASLVPLGAGRASAAAALTLLVGGPDGERTSRWGNACALAMQAGFPGAPSISTQPVGGLDGVTGANRLDVLVVPDGKTAAILPGAALIAWLTSDQRVHFDPTRWVPLMAGGNSGVLVARLPAGAAADLKTLRSLAPLKLAADQPESNDLAALLALARLGVPVVPAFGLRGTDAKINAFIAGQVDAVFLCGEGVPEDIAPLSAGGGVPVFSLGLQNADGSISPDPAFPSLPDATVLGPSVTPFLDTAYRAVACAARLDFIMVLPRLTDPGIIAQWRQAASEAAAAPALVAAASASSISLQSAPAVIADLTALNLAPADQADMLSFLAKNFGWQPG